MTAPDRIGPYRKSTDPKLVADAKTRLDAFTRSTDGVKQAIVAYYDHTQQPGTIAVIVAAAINIDDPAKELDSAFLSNLGVKNIRAVDTGPLGGVAECGSQVFNGGIAGSFCGWADHGSIGVVGFIGLDPGSAAADLLTFRAAVVTRG